MNKVIVIMLTFNGEKFLYEQLTSILNQESIPIDVLVSDNGSTDKTNEILVAFQKKYSNIKVNKYKTRQSFFYNFLHAIDNVDFNNYSYVALADQDDIFKPNKFIKLINYLKLSNCSGCSSSVQCFGNSKKILKQSKNITKLDFLFEGAGQGCSFVVKSSVMNNFKDFCQSNKKIISQFYYHDWLIYLFCRASNLKWGFYCDDELTEYRIHNFNNTGNKYSYRGIKHRCKKLLNGWYFNQVITANNVARKINKEIPDLTEINFFPFLRLLLFCGRRKYSDRIFAFLPLLFIYSLKRIKIFFVK